MNASAVAGSVTALLPLSLLEAVRAQDRPDEVIEDEQFAISLPRRLGLTGVVDNQIRQYETASRSGRMVSMDEFTNLIKLVLKRPSACCAHSAQFSGGAGTRWSRLRALRSHPAAPRSSIYWECGRGRTHALFDQFVTSV